MSQHPSKLPPLTGKPFASLRCRKLPPVGVVEAAQFRHNPKKKTLIARGLTDETARRALERISLATTAVTRRVKSEVGCALRVQVRDVVVVLARDLEWEGVGFIVTAFATETAVQAAHRERVLEVAAYALETVTLSERLALISEEF